MKKTTYLKTLLVAACLCLGSMSAWADVIETVGTEGTGDAWASRKYSTAYALAPGETYHFTFTNTSYGSENWNNWLLDCKATADTSVDDWYFTMRSDNYGWGKSYDATMRSCNFVWANFKTVMNGATVDMYINYNSNDKIIRTYATITKSETEWYYNFASKSIDAEQVYLFLSEELAVLEITTAEKVAKLPDGAKNIYKRSITNGYGYTWDTNTSNADYTGWTATGGTKTLDLTDGLKLSLGNAGATISNTISPTIGNIINLDATFFLKGATGANSEGQNAAFFRFGNIYILNDAQYCTSKYLLNGGFSTSNAGTTFHSTSAGSSSIYRSTGITYHLQLEINTTTNKVNSMKVYVNGAAEPSLSISDQTLTSYDYTTLAFGYIKGRTSTASIEQLKDISITETPQVISVVDYTVKFQDALGNTLKDDVVHDNGVVGEVYQATATDMDTFYNNADVSMATKKYVYNSGQNTETKASSTASENVITLVFDVYDKTAYTVNAQASGVDIKTGIASGSAYLDGSTTACWSKYYKVGSQWYVADESTYVATITSATTNVSYTATDAIDYFFEFEDLSKSASFAATQDGEALSNNNSARFSKNSRAWTTAIASGTYTLNMYCFGTNAKSESLSIYYCDTDGSNPVFIGTTTKCKANDWELKETTDIVIPDGKALCLYNTDDSNNSNYLIDYFTLKRTGDATVSKTISSVGWATYCSPYALDFSSSIDNLTAAYTITGNDGNVLELSPITTTIPAEIGILLKGNGTCAIPVIASSDTDVSSNLLKGVLTNTNKDQNTIYVLMNGDNGIGFYKNANETAFTVGANTAYLDVKDISSARAFIGFDDEETTGVQHLEEKNFVFGDFFDLQGRRVAQPTKGLYIVNGRKIVIK